MFLDNAYSNTPVFRLLSEKTKNYTIPGEAKPDNYTLLGEAKPDNYTILGEATSLIKTISGERPFY